MARLLLTLCYALTALPGPGLCCCTFRPSAEQATAPAPSEPCCPCCRTECPGTASDQEPAPSRCGCKHQPADDATITSVTQPPESPVASIDAPSSPVAAPAQAEAAAAPPFHEPARLLRVFHLLRC